jgi:hypothetical protein
MTIRNKDHLGELLHPNKVFIDFDTLLSIPEDTIYSHNAHLISLKAFCKITALLGNYYNENFITHINIPLHRRMVIKGIVN